MLPAKTNQTAGIVHSDPFEAFTRVADVSELTNHLRAYPTAAFFCMPRFLGCDTCTPARGWIYVIVWTQTCRQIRLPPSCLGVITN
jgi:hypothetical protein